MRKGTRTRRLILDKAASLMNRHGFLSVPLSEIMAETGLGKGGIYNHFASKEEMALEVFDHAANAALERFRGALATEERPASQLQALMRVFLEGESALPGGCPLLNAAIESDDAHPILRERVRTAMDAMKTLIEAIVQRGMDIGEFGQDTDPEEVAWLLISMLEGALMLSKLYQDPQPLQAAVEHLCSYVQRLTAT